MCPGAAAQHGSQSFQPRLAASWMPRFKHRVRAGFRMVLDRQPEMTVVGEADDGADAPRLLRSTEAEVVVMDLRMPILTGWPRPGMSEPPARGGACWS
ncbi:hypothetical protein Acsp02_97060 [Actinoplanes sp. NBRC 103695]|nr:hypothetical protein Acsp02_97060 [Actinoplanes sp. NBRC 103695]